MSSFFRFINDGLAFALELAALAALGYWGFHVGGPVWAKTLLAVASVAIAVALWGTFAAPRTIVKTSTVGVLATKALVFGAATAALYDLNVFALATVFAVLVVFNTTAVTFLRKQHFVKTESTISRRASLRREPQDEEVFLGDTRQADSLDPLFNLGHR